MEKHFIFEIANEPGSLAEVTETLGDAGINIEAISAGVIGEKAVVQILTNHQEDAIEVLQEANISFTNKPVLTLKMKDTPGQVAKLTAALSNAGVNITAFYVTMKGQQVLSAEPIEKAEEIANELRML